MRRQHGTRENERGLSMIEVLVAVAVLVIAGTIALVLYDAARKSFKKGENASEQQQAVRIAFDRVSSDLRLTGFNYNPDGDKARPDEQVEAAYDTAIVFRADFDAEDPASALDPETNLTAGGAFLSISTGNDEVVAYVLAKPDGSSPDTLSFDADVQEVPRDGDVETVSIPNVALVHDDPPYTLYRVTLNNDAGTWGTGDFIVRTPLVENVRSLSFRYYDQPGGQINGTFDLTTIADDIGGSDAAADVTLRSTIRRFGVDVVGLTRDPDLTWKDPEDTNPETWAYRKFQLTGDITPRNIGMTGVRDIGVDILPPSKPGTPSLYPGHCGGLYITWPPNPAGDQVISYRIEYGTSSGNLLNLRIVSGTSYYLAGLADGTTYYVTIKAKDEGGNLSPASDEASATTSNTNAPKAPVNLAATARAYSGAIKVTWDAVTENTANTAGDPDSPAIRDLEGYRVYRGPNANFNADPSSLIADETVVKTQASPTYTDLNVVNCRKYHYRISAVDACGVESAVSPSDMGEATSRVDPMPPANVQAFVVGVNKNQIVWDAVNQDADGKPIFVDTYNVYRTPPVPAEDLPPLDGYVYIGTAQGATQHVDVIMLPLGYTVFYKVSALDDCVNESQLSLPAAPTCAFSGSVEFVTPQEGDPVAGIVAVEVQVVNGGDTYVRLVLEFFNEDTGQVEDTAQLDEPGPVWSYNWTADPPGPYVITAYVTNDQFCTKSTSIRVSAGRGVGCCLSPPNPSMDPIIMDCTAAGRLSEECKEITFQVINNGCQTAVAIDEMTITWVDVVGNGTKIDEVDFDSSPIWNVGSSLSPVQNVFSDPKPAIGVDRDSTNPVQVTYVFSKVTSSTFKGVVYQDTFTTSFVFRLLDAQGNPSALTGVCGPETGMFGNLIVEPHP